MENNAILFYIIGELLLAIIANFIAEKLQKIY